MGAGEADDDDRVAMFWILAVLITGFVTAPVVWPLFRQRTVAEQGTRDVELHAAALAALDADLAREAIGPEDARIARAEIGRRLLRASSRSRRDQAADGRPAAMVLAAIVAVALPASALAFYGQTGEPSRGDLPLAARQSSERNVDPTAVSGDFQAMVAAAEARLAENPQDGRGWDVLAPIYARIGDLRQAETAYRNALALMGENAARLTGYGEVQVRIAGGEVTAAARESFARANALDAAALTPRLFLALDATQEGRTAEAAEAWTALLLDAPGDAPWRPMAEAALREAGGLVPESGAPAAAQVIERAAATPAGTENEMIGGMVAGLASRLEREPNDAEGWARLVQAYGVLGDEAAGQAALDRARATFGTGTEEWARIADTAARAGFVVSTGGQP